MKTAFIYAIALGLTLVVSSAEASEKKICKVETNDLGTIVGKGRTQSAAFEDAATQCFEKHASRYRMKYKRDLANDQGEAIIDICANVRCS